MELLINYALRIVAAFLAVWIHEIPKYYLTLYLTKPMYRNDVKIKDVWRKSIDPIGYLLLVFAGFGWQMPLKIDAAKLTNRKNGLIAISLLGFLTSLITAMVCLTIGTKLSLSDSYVFFVMLLHYTARFSIAIMVANILPVLPLDMSKIIYAISPSTYFKMVQNGTLIQSIFIIFIAFDGLSRMTTFALIQVIQLVKIWI